MASENLPAVREDAPALTPFQVIEKVITSGDLSKMDPPARVAFYWRTCESLGLNPLTRPFQYITLNGQLTLYARKDCTEQLRRKHHVSVTGIRRERDEEAGTYTVYAHGRTRDGDEDESTGVVSIKGLSGEALANALMKAETKAKRRLTLSLVGLGFLDESEIEGASAVDVDPDTGEIRQPPPKPSLLESVQQQRARMAQPVSEATGENEAPRPAAPTPQAEPEDVEEAVWAPADEESAPAMSAAEFDRRAKAAARAGRLTTAMVQTAHDELMPGVKGPDMTEAMWAQLAHELGLDGEEAA